MGRRRQKESGLDALLAAPWWVSAVLAVGGYAAFQWIIPAMTAGNQVLKATGQAFKPFGIFLVVLFGFLALVLYAKQRITKPQGIPHSPGRREPTLDSPDVPIITKSGDVANVEGSSTNHDWDGPVIIVAAELNLS